MKARSPSLEIDLGHFFQNPRWYELIFDDGDGDGMRHTFDWLAKAQAASQHEDPSIVSLRIAQRISCTLQAENARAILQRTVGPSSAERPPSGWDEI